MEKEYEDLSILRRWATDGAVRRSRISQCSLCKHLEKADICTAFPNGIPREISSNNFVHNKPYSNDNGIMYEPDDEEDGNINFEPLGKKKTY